MRGLCPRFGDRAPSALRRCGWLSDLFGVRLGHATFQCRARHPEGVRHRRALLGLSGLRVISLVISMAEAFPLIILVDDPTA